MIIVNENWCKGCNICITRCPVNALEESDKLNRRGVYPPRLKENNNCNFCRLCELLCPDLAIMVIHDKETKEIPKKTLHPPIVKPIGRNVK
ncbi:MAG TPA: 4Fe-4S dicluster domain-containing protein [Thermoplasmata archaeon]|nr:4Fe-4S dicluster domain-containing protein [Thermoplasmata archaeon]